MYLVLVGREGVEPSVSYSPTAYKAAALTDELPPHMNMVWYSYSFLHFFFPLFLFLIRCLFLSVEQMTGYDPANPVWKTGMLPTTSHLHVGVKEVPGFFYSIIKFWYLCISEK